VGGLTSGGQVRLGPLLLHFELGSGLSYTLRPGYCVLWQVVAIFGTNYGPIGTVVTAKYTTNRALTSVVSASAALNASYVSSGPCRTWLLALQT
jgi:hypothetical protein